MQDGMGFAYGRCSESEADMSNETEKMQHDRKLDRREMLAGASAIAVALAASSGAKAMTLDPGAGRGIPIQDGLVQRVASQESGTLVVGYTQEAVNFNPLLYVNTGVETAVEFAVFDSLWKIDEAGKFIPNLATEIPSKENGGVSADGLTWTIKLRQGVKWHDGQPFTAKDVVFTYQTMINPKIAVRGRAGHDRVKELVAVDDHTIKATLGEPFAPYLVVWQKTSIVPAHLLADVPDMNTAAFNTQPVGTGPFKFKTRVAGDRIEFEANPDYHGDGPHLSTMVQKYVPDQQVLFAQFQTGQVQILDLQGLPPELLPRARQLPKKTMLTMSTSFVEFIYFNCGKPQFSDKRVRKALYMAMDRKTLIDKLYYGVPKGTLSYLPSDHWAYNGALKDPGYDPKKAAAMLDEAGWKVGTDGVREKDGVKLSFTISTTAGNKSRERSQQFLQQNLKAINVDMQINNMPASVVWGEYTVQSKFDTLQVAWDPLLYPDPDYSARIMSDQIPAKGGSGANYVQYQNPEIDDLCRRGVAEVDTAKRKEIYAKIQEILLDDVPFAPLFGLPLIMGTDNTVKNYKPNAYVAINAWNCNEWAIG